MEQKLLLIIFILLRILGVSQNIKENIQDNLSAIRTISPLDTNFSDLTPLKIAIGNSRVVMLGEQDHGDAPSFLAKTRIVKYLHEEMGFNIIAFESDFYGLHQTFQSIEKIKQNIYPIWTKCSQNEPIFEYIKGQIQSNTPIIVTGFDSRHRMSYSQKHYVKEFDSLLITTEIPFYFSSSYKTFKTILHDIIIKEYKSTTPKIKQNYFLSCLDTIQKQLEQISFKNKSFWIQEMSNLKGHSVNAWKNGQLSEKYDNGIRDKQMGNNLLWLIQKKYPNEKIIVWAHNYHIAKNIDRVESIKKKAPNSITMGNEVFKSIGSQCYIIGFNSYSGKAGRITGKNKSYTVRKPKGQCFENWVKKKEFEYAFIDFHSLLNETNKFKMKGLGHYEEKGNWTEVFDGIFYIEKMYKCDKKE